MFPIEGARKVCAMPKQIRQEDNCIDYIEMSVTDIARSKQFYGSVFGWTFTDYGENYCEFTDGRIKGGFEKSTDVTCGGPLVVLYHADLESVLDKVKTSGGHITRHIFQFPGGERFQFCDPEGYELAVWRHT